MASARWTAFVVALAIAAAAAGCGGSDSGPHGTKIAVVTPGTRDDPDWGRQAVAAAKKVAARLHVQAEIAEASSASEARAALERFAKDAQLIVVPYEGDRAAAIRLATATEVPVLVFGDAKAPRKGIVGDVEMRLPDGAFAAGMLAAHAAIYKSVGIVVCDDTTSEGLANRYRIASAFVAGARGDDPKVRAFYVRAGADGHADAAAAQAATERITIHGPAIRVSSTLSEPGAQMVLSLCGAATPGVMDGIVKADAEHQFVGIVGDKAPINEENMVLTSVLVDPAPVIQQALKDIKAGRFGAQPYALDLKRGLSLLATGRTPGDAYEAGEKAKQMILDQLVGLPETVDEATLKTYIKG